MSWLTQSVTGRSEQSPGFGPKPVRVEFWWTSDIATGPPPKYFSFPCHRHSIRTAYSNLIYLPPVLFNFRNC